MIAAILWGMLALICWALLGLLRLGRSQRRNLGMTAEERLAAVRDLQPEMCSFDPAPFNLGLFQLAERYAGKFKHRWEPQILEYLKNHVY